MAGYRGLLTERYRGLLTGEKKPWELPEFKGMEYTLAKRGALARRGAGRQMRQMGIRGPAVASTIRGMEEAETGPLGEVMRSTYGELPGQAMRWQKHLDRLEQMVLERAERHYQAHRGRKQARQTERMRGIGQGFGAGMGALCILATASYGENSEEVKFLRFYRDNILSDAVVRGYYIFSDAILPLMEFGPFKRIVRQFIVNPLIRTGLRWMKWGGFYLLAPFDTLITKCFLGFWGIIGNRSPYRRTNGEIF